MKKHTTTGLIKKLGDIHILCKRGYFHDNYYNCSGGRHLLHIVSITIQLYGRNTTQKNKPSKGLIVKPKMSMVMVHN
jgi:hypothetical protein